MLVICVRRKYVTLIYDLPGWGGGYLPGRAGGFTRAGGGGLQILSKVIQTQNVPKILKTPFSKKGGCTRFDDDF